MNLTQVIKEKAYQMGFSLVGVTHCEQLPHKEVFLSWLDQGRHGQMAYLDTARSRQCRASPRLLLEGCQSILVLGMRYPKPGMMEENRQSANSPTGRLAAYARGEDYHRFVPKLLEGLVCFIDEKLGYAAVNRWYSDTGPLLERELAQRAGLGWIGKNTCLINPQGGSYFLLAEILLGVELEPDQPFLADRCGSCNRCMKACPTGCILPDRTLDARRCISYLTIELKTGIPQELRPLMGNWIFGCDVCQQVCPWNRFASVEMNPAYGNMQEIGIPNLIEDIQLSTEGFNHKFQHNPIKRAKRKGYLRNLAVALGNLHLSSAMPILVQILHDDSEPLVRAHAAWAIGEIGGSKARQALASAEDGEVDKTVLQEIHNSLLKL